MQFPVHLRSALLVSLFCAHAFAQVMVSGRVVDETGAGVAGARVEIRSAAGAVAAVKSPNAARGSVSIWRGRATTARRDYSVAIWRDRAISIWRGWSAERESY